MFHRNLTITVKEQKDSETVSVHHNIDDIFIDGNNKLTLVRWGTIDNPGEVIDFEEWDSYSVTKDTA